MAANGTSPLPGHHVVIYFAYGSNMLRERLEARVGEARRIGPAHLTGFRLSFGKRSVDGSGKCTIIVDQASSAVWGVAYELTDRQKRLMDEFEGPGYSVAPVHPAVAKVCTEAYTYIARIDSIDDALIPYSWYKELVLAGAVQAGLPSCYVACIESVPAAEDPDGARTRDNRRLIKASP